MRLPRAWLLGLGLLLPAADARAEETAALVRRAPALELGGPVAAMNAPVTLGGAGWGPFRRMCVDRRGAARDDRPGPLTSASCLEVVEADEQAGGVWRLTLRVEPRGGRHPISFTVTRDGRGQVGEAELHIPPGLDRPPPEVAAHLAQVLRTAVAANAMERTEVRPAAGFIMPLPLEGVAPDIRYLEGERGLACTPQGLVAINGREALVASCAGRAQFDQAPGTTTVGLGGHFAIDTGTGMVVRHSYATHIVTARPGQEPLVQRGFSAQRLE
jgi:hypothetical protein